MTTEILVAILSLIGTLAGSISGILISNKLVNFRLKSLEEKVSKHNSVIERTFVLEEKAKVINNRLNDLEHKVFK